jgi:uncharacterized 2Fe-2S/4Fe-4S cluster protein (DUF4445 family)
MTREIIGEIEYRHGKVQATLLTPMLVTEAVREIGLVLNTSCGGKGICGGCAVDLHTGTYRQEGRGYFTVSPETPVRALGCKTTIVKGPFRFSIPRRSLVETEERVVADFVIKEAARFDPTVRQITLCLPIPTLENAHGDYEEIARELRENHHLELARAGLSVLQQLPAVIRKNNYAITVTLAWLDEGWELLAVEPAGENHNDKYKCLGLAVDIGTTTVAISLVDLAEGKIVDTVSSYNQQIQQADDVASRIARAGTPEGRNRLQQLIIRQTINPLIQTLCSQHKLDARHLMRMSVSGNTVMWNLFLGIDPTPLGMVPFQPACLAPGSVRAHELGLAIHPDAPVDVVPSISAYVGGDIVSDIASAHLDRTNNLSLLIDIGTNGEIALTDGGRMLVTACAAGPAFEGLRTSHGMRASVGAVERVNLSKNGTECSVETVGGAKPIGICGSGLIDFLAEGFRAGLVTHAGRFQRELIDSNPRLRLASGSTNMLEYVLVDRSETEDATHDITVTEKDIETLLQAKAAIFAAVHLLLKRIGKTFADIDHAYLAGGFARYINIENAITIGLLPEIDLDKFKVIGNGSLAGAFLGLVDRTIWTTFRRISEMPEVVELNLDPEFQDEFTFALFLPNMQEELFPKTRANL